MSREQTPNDPQTATRERLPDGSILERDEHGEVLGIYVGDDVWAAWEAERRRSLAACRASRPASLDDLHARLEAAGLRPVTDHELGLVHADCPECGASVEDGLWRSLAVVPRAGKLLCKCGACGLEEVARV